MSSDEEALAVGRVVAEHQKVKSRYAALRSECERVGSAITSIGSSVKFGHLVPQTDLTILDAEKIRALSAETASTYTRLRELESRLAELGLSPTPPDR